jgi:hypothetical protein
MYVNEWYTSGHFTLQGKNPTSPLIDKYEGMLPPGLVWMFPM